MESSGYIMKPWFKDVKEIKGTASQEEAEALLSTGRWKLIFKINEPLLYSLGRVVGERGRETNSF